MCALVIRPTEVHGADRPIRRVVLTIAGSKAARSCSLTLGLPAVSPSDSGQMPTLMIDTVCGIPAFKVQVGPDETIRSLQIKCAKAAHVNTLTWKNMKLINNKEDVRVRLSRGRVFLKPTDTVAALGLQNGSRLMLHTRSRPLIPNYNGHPLVMTAPLPVYSFGREDYDLWVNVCAPNGQRLFKLKLTSEMNTTKVISMAVKQAKLRGFGDLEQAAENGEVKLKHKGVEMKPGKSISVYHVQTGHEIDLHGLGEQYEAPSSPAPSLLQLLRPGSTSHNLLAQLQAMPSFAHHVDERRAASRPASARRPSSAGMLLKERATWMPVGANEALL